jgi:D-alanyl-D-alanine-carboxypeptidase/D-alanyl-D-alanine-endopeptidase
MPRLPLALAPVLALALAMFLASGARAAAPPASDAAIRELVRNWLQESDGVGISIGVYDAGQRRFYNAGVPRLDANKPSTQHTVYEIGTMTRAFSGQILARAIVEGRAAPDDDVAKFLEDPYPNLENGGERVRLVHLTNRTSGLADNIPDLSQVRPVPGQTTAATHMSVLAAYTRGQFLRQLHRVRPQRQPGIEPGSSNVAHMLLGVALEKMYGERFEAILAREIEKPLRMASGVVPDPKRIATGYTEQGDALPPYEARMGAASNALRYSADDLLKFAVWQLVERDASVKLAHKPTWTSGDGRNALAYYWIVGQSPHGRRVYVSGGSWGFAGLCELYPEAQVALVLLTNKNADGAQESLRALSARIVETLRPGSLTNPSSSADAPPPDR